jgi:hypothetical protein
MDNIQCVYCDSYITKQNIARHHKSEQCIRIQKLILKKENIHNLEQNKLKDINNQICNLQNKIIKFKLKNTAEHLEDRQYFVGYEHEVSRIRLVNKLIERVQEEWYGMEYFDYHTSTFEFIPTEDKDKNGDPYYTMHSEIIEDYLDNYFKKYPLIYKRVIAKLGSDSDRTRIALYMGRENHERAKRLLFNILNERIENWWN